MGGVICQSKLLSYTYFKIKGNCSLKALQFNCLTYTGENTCLILLQCLLEPVRCLINLLPVPSHAAKPQVAVHIAGVFPQNGLVVSLRLVKVTQGLAETAEVVGYRHGDLCIVGLVLYGLLFAPIQCLFIV